MPAQLPCKLLIFEDDPAIRSMLIAFFTAQGSMVAAAENGKDALARIQAEQPDILLLDVIMPFQDGLSILRQFREYDPTTPVIMLTEKGEVDDKVTGLEYGADDYMTKPFSPKELLARVKALWRRSSMDANRSSLPQTLGRVTINPASREASLPDHPPIPLTKTEFDLLFHLGGKPGIVVTHGELLKEVLGYEPDTETKSLVMHIANLRRKLDRSCPGELTIKAVTGIGYKLILGENE